MEMEHKLYKQKLMSQQGYRPVELNMKLRKSLQVGSLGGGFLSVIASIAVLLSIN